MTEHELQAVLDRIPHEWGKSINCGPGWYALIADVDRALATLDPDYVVHQCKEKFGGLRYYFDPSPDTDPVMARAMRLIVDGAEAKSFTICEETGGRGVLMRKKGGHWLRTLDPAKFADDWEVVQRESWR